MKFIYKILLFLIYCIIFSNAKAQENAKKKLCFDGMLPIRIPCTTSLDFLIDETTPQTDLGIMTFRCPPGTKRIKGGPCKRTITLGKKKK
ncbi:hypothetical protein PVAND_008835 [Polypedilum vanderplanki]|uniref:Uncharacterized protein n=1 Tax=Polypedilum vanderplanki TaxID=319348 RepID=A0A9J6CB81_POLVA|nr:hypothetical protein PVAND_008835 [Polypedilum vanderplanki]